MIKILQIRETPLTKCAGIDANCQALVKLFNSDEDLNMLPVIDYTRHTIPLIKQYYLDAKEIAHSIEVYNPDVIHIHGAYSFTLFVAIQCAQKHRKRIILSPHLHPFYALRRPRLGWIFFHLITKPLLRNIDAVFTINNEDTALFSRYHNNVVRVPHWSKYEDQVPDPKNPKMILFVGRINDPVKGFEHIYHLPVGKYEIHCVGKGELQKRADIIQHINISDEELRRLYSKASLLVIPSKYEAFSYVALEALFNETPVLLSSRVRIADYLEGVEGYKEFEYGNAADFCAKVDEAVGLKVDVKAVREIFDIDKIKAVYKKVYLSPINK